jgi:hypothetical protein
MTMMNYVDGEHSIFFAKIRLFDSIDVLRLNSEGATGTNKSTKSSSHGCPPEIGTKVS